MNNRINYLFLFPPKKSLHLWRTNYWRPSLNGDAKWVPHLAVTHVSSFELARGESAVPPTQNTEGVCEKEKKKNFIFFSFSVQWFRKPHTPSSYISKSCGWWELKSTLKGAIWIYAAMDNSIQSRSSFFFFFMTGMHPAVSLMCQTWSVWEKMQKHTVGFPWQTYWGTDGEQKICWRGSVNTPIHNKYAQLVHQWICQHRSLSINSHFGVSCLKIKLSIGSLQIPSSGQPF